MTMTTMAPPSDEVFIEPIGEVLTAEEYDALPENPRRELVDGVIQLAIEVVSRGSETADRFVKPRQYAKAGIEHYWRVETEPDIVVHTFRTFRLGDDATYVPTGVFKSGDVINAPGLRWAQVPVDDLVDEG